MRPRQCRFGAACRYLRTNSCRYFHPDSDKKWPVCRYGLKCWNIDCHRLHLPSVQRDRVFDDGSMDTVVGALLADLASMTIMHDGALVRSAAAPRRRRALADHHASTSERHPPPCEPEPEECVVCLEAIVSVTKTACGKPHLWLLQPALLARCAFPLTARLARCLTVGAAVGARPSHRPHISRRMSVEVEGGVCVPRLAEHVPTVPCCAVSNKKNKK
jgi:hypothetical protein